MPPICIQTKNVNLPRTYFKICRNRELTGGPWRGTRPSSSPAFLHTTRSANATTNQNAITAPTHSIAKKRTYREETLQERDLAGGATPMYGTEETEPARAERGPVRRSSASPSLYALSHLPRLKIPVMRWILVREGEGEPEERRTRPPSARTPVQGVHFLSPAHACPAPPPLLATEK
jgi:hypothetical protein